MTEDAIKAKSFYTNPAPQKIQVGDAASKSPFVVCIYNIMSAHDVYNIYSVHIS